MTMPPFRTLIGYVLFPLDVYLSLAVILVCVSIDIFHYYQLIYYH